MTELINITEQNGKQAVDARELHKTLESTRKFAEWISARIKTYGFIEGTDFFRESGKNNRGRPTVEYVITIEMAKQLSMVEKTKKGQEVRLYFLDIESKYKEQVKPKSQAELLLESAQMLVEQEKRLDQHEEKLKLLEAKSDLNSGNTGYLTIRGYCNLKGIKVPVREAQSLGWKAKKISKELGYKTNKTRDELYGEVGSYRLEVLEILFDEND